MAETFQFLAMQPDIEFVPPNRTKEVRVYTYRALPSGVVFFFTAYPTGYAPTAIELTAKQIAAAVNKAAALPGVEGMTLEEGLNSSENVARKWRVAVASTSGDSLADLVLEYGTVFDARFANRVKAERAELDEVEGL